MSQPIYKITADRRTMLVLLALDIACAIFVFNIIANLRGISTHLITSPLVVPIAIMVISLLLVSGYNGRTDMLSVDYTSQHAIALLASMALMLLVTFVMFPDGYELHASRGVIALSFIILIPLTIGYRRMIYLQNAPGRSESSFVYVGDRAGCQAFREECWRMGMQQAVIDSHIGAAEENKTRPGAVGLMRRPLGDVLAEAQAGTVAVEAIVLRESEAELEPAITEKLVDLFFRGVPTYTLEYFHQAYWQKVPLYLISPVWLFQEGFRITREPVFERLKRASDIGLAALGLLLAAPIIVVAGAAIWLEDRGPVFFRQSRIGKNNVPFQLLKLRTMRDAGPGDNPYTQPGDDRITRVGRFLRASRLDELPQIWNVLNGDMSLIGPRAEWDKLVADYERQIPCYHFRHMVKPGITGWAQVSYRYGANLEDTIRKLEYDLYYIRYYSFQLDASIVLKTIHIMLFGKGR